MRVYYNDNNKDVCLWLEQLIKNGDITRGDVDDRSIEEIKPEDVAGYDRCHFFAGIGTWDYALNQAGRGDMPVWTASLPCQPFSSAGKQLGRKDERHLLPTYLELVRKCKPKIQFGEQVASSEVVGTELEASFVIAVQNGEYAKANKLAKRLVAQKGFTFTSRWVDDLHAEMEKAGYTFGYGVLGAHSTAEEAKTGFENELFEFISRRLGDVESDLFKNWWFERGFGDGNSAEPAHIRQRLYWVGVAHSTGEQINSPNESGFYAESSSGSWLGDPEHEQHQGCLFGHNEELEQNTERPAGKFTGSGEIEWVYCRDNKYRPIKPGVKPLVDGVAEKLGRGGDTSAQIEADNTQEARTMRLKGYGNAIQAQTATAFIRAFINTTGDTTWMKNQLKNVGNVTPNN